LIAFRVFSFPGDPSREQIQRRRVSGRFNAAAFRADSGLCLIGFDCMRLRTIFAVPSVRRRGPRTRERTRRGARA
jgi:hypothetical protein